MVSVRRARLTQWNSTFFFQRLGTDWGQSMQTWTCSHGRKRPGFVFFLFTRGRHINPVIL